MDFVDVLVRSPHILFRHSFHGDILTVTFHSKPFFFLSQFAWIGAALRKREVRFNPLPSPQPWDEASSIDEFARLLHLSRAVKIIGVHARIYSTRPFEYFDYGYLDLLMKR
jgi:hypothetical protein